MEKEVKNSSQIKFMRANIKGDTGTLEVTFKGGKRQKDSTYIYLDVTKAHIEGIWEAKSVGSYLHKNFTDVYKYERVLDSQLGDK